MKGNVCIYGIDVANILLDFIFYYYFFSFYLLNFNSLYNLFCLFHGLEEVPTFRFKGEKLIDKIESKINLKNIN